MLQADMPIMSKTEGASLAISLCNERSDKATVRISDSRYFVATYKENVVNFDHDFDHFQNKVSNALLSQKGRLGRPKIGNGLYWDTKSSVNPLPESWSICKSTVLTIVMKMMI